MRLGWQVERGLNQAEHEHFFGRFLAMADRQRLEDTDGLVADRRD